MRKGKKKKPVSPFTTLRHVKDGHVCLFICLIWNNSYQPFPPLFSLTTSEMCSGYLGKELR